MQWVLDASIAAAWCFEDESTSRTDALLEKLGREPAVVPGHWSLEVSNVLATVTRSGRISVSKRNAFVEMLNGFSIFVDGETHRCAWGEILRLADVFGLTSYDAAYLELALRMRLPLATNDKALKKAAKSSRVALL